MQNKELIEELLQGLGRTQAEEVTVSKAIVADAIGEGQCEELCYASVSLGQSAAGKGSLIEMAKAAKESVKTAGMGTFDREELVSAIEGALEATGTEESGGGEY